MWYSRLAWLASYLPSSQNQLKGRRRSFSGISISLTTNSWASMLDICFFETMTWLIYVFSSKNALITLRNGNFYICCRIGDLRWSHCESKSQFFVMLLSTGSNSVMFKIKQMSLDILRETQRTLERFWWKCFPPPSGTPSSSSPPSGTHIFSSLMSLGKWWNGRRQMRER